MGIDAKAQTDSQHEVELNGSAEHENAQIKELQRNIRSINKKITAMAKVDAVIAENPNLTLEELVATRKINIDQKMQAQKKPMLQFQLSQLETQLEQFKSFQQELEVKSQMELARLKEVQEISRLQDREAHQEQLENVSRESLKSGLLVVSQFLKTAAQRRLDEPEDSPETHAFESILSYFYGGDAQAAEIMEKLIRADTSAVPSIEGEDLPVSFSRVKELATESVSDSVEEHASQNLLDTDPTIATATLTEQSHELDATTLMEAAGQNSVIAAQGSVGNSAANTGAILTGNGANSADTGTQLIKERDVAETIAPPLPSIVNSTDNWVAPAKQTLASKPAPSRKAHFERSEGEGDGFKEVQHNGSSRQRNGTGDVSRGRGGRGRGTGGRGGGSSRGRRGTSEGTPR